MGETWLLSFPKAPVYFFVTFQGSPFFQVETYIVQQIQQLVVETNDPEYVYIFTTHFSLVKYL